MSYLHQKLKTYTRVTRNKALSELDRVQHPPAKQQEAKEHNNGGKGLKKGLAPDASYRAVTADGGKLSDDGVVF